MRRLLAALGAAMLLAVSCGGGGENGSGGPATPVPTRPASTAKLSIVSPEAGAVVDGPKVAIELALDGGTIVAEATTDLKPDEGHIHLSVDGNLVSQTFALRQEVEMEPGNHLVQAEFVAGDHAFFNPRVLSTVTFTVK